MRSSLISFWIALSVSQIYILSRKLHHSSTHQGLRYRSCFSLPFLLFATLAILLERRAPNAHTFLEVTKAHYGTNPHVVFMVFGIVTNFPGEKLSDTILTALRRKVSYLWSVL